MQRLSRYFKPSLLYRYSSPTLSSSLSYRYVHNIRNVGVVAHIDAGKTTTSEQMLYLSGEINNVGRVDDGDTVMDFLPQERERGITISSAATTFKWKDCNVNLIDTPGHVDFTIEVERSARVLDGTILVLDAVAGVQAQTLTVWKQIQKQSIPCVAFVNKMDREGANFYHAIASIKERLGANAVPIQLPIDNDGDFRGYVDLIGLKKIIWPANTVGTNTQPSVDPLGKDDTLYDDATSARLQLIESIAEIDAQFQDKYLECENPMDLSDIDILVALRRCCLQNSVIPVLCGSSLKGKGVHSLLDSIVGFLPSPADRPPCLARQINGKQTRKIDVSVPQLCALAFKVVHDNARGRMVFVRTYSGNLDAKQVILNSTNRSKERVLQILKVQANDYELLDNISAGNVACLIGLKNTVTGDTLVEEKGQLRDYVLDGLQIPQAVYSISIEPEKSSQQTALEEALAILQVEDPSLLVEQNKESGQTILKGIGELHLDIVCDKLTRQYGLNVSRGRAYVAFRESLGESFAAEAQPTKYIFDKLIAGKRMFAGAVVDISMNNSKSADNCSIEISPNAKASATLEELDAFRDGLQIALSRGPFGFPVTNLCFKVQSLIKDNDTTVGSIRACASSFSDSLLGGEHHVFLEPTMTVEVDVPTKYVGDVLSDLTVKRRGRISDICARDETGRSCVTVLVPFAEMLGYATSLRSMTQGEALFSMEFAEYSITDKSVVDKF